MARAEPTRAIYGLNKTKGRLPASSVAGTVRWLQRHRFNAVFGGYRDPTLRRALQRARIKVYASLSLFVGKHHWKRHPESRPIDAHGKPIPRQGWYAGVCPNQPWLRRAKVRQAVRLARRGVDGIWLDFVRYPARWERRSRRPAGKGYQTCFCPRCLRDFARDAKLRYPAKLSDAASKARWILAHHRRRFTAFKVEQITRFVGETRRALKNAAPEIRLGLFSVPWRERERGNAIRAVIGQDLAALARHVDVISPMAYHKMVGAPPSWIASHVKYLAKLTGKPVLPVVQVCSVPSRLTAAELEQALTAGASSPSAGLVLFSMRHFRREKRGATWQRWLGVRRSGR